ncbi:hypothetical protein [Marinimicrobium alkaliphilum]|uniref:hypothetical protein n=1 Tax=Marinimicrobium alkaliphilum TaxID=2202654 RepID=UPI000DB9CA0C|nr:hypothetical protein [Marinimicrobium alkaliphilum]
MHMSVTNRYIYAAELGLSFGPATLLWLWALLAVPSLLLETLSGSANYAIFLAAMILGAFALVGIYSLAKVVVFRSSIKLSFVAVTVLCLMGAIAALMQVGSNTSSWVNIAIFSLPIICASHFLAITYIGGKHLTKSSTTPLQAAAGRS